MDNSGSAFPHDLINLAPVMGSSYANHPFVMPTAGLTKRELFAVILRAGFGSYDSFNKGRMLCDYRDPAKQAIRDADALILELAKGEK